MTYLICYDISNDALRLRITKRLERAGCQRLQKSVFLAPHFELKRLAILRGSIQHLLLKHTLSPEESVLAIPIERDNTHDILWAGHSPRLNSLLQKHLFKLF